MIVVHGILEIYNGGLETEGPVCVVVDHSQDTIEGLHQEKATYFLRNGDLLKIFNDASRQDTVWEGRIDVYSAGGKPVQQGFTRESWFEMFSRRLPCELVQTP